MNDDADDWLALRIAPCASEFAWAYGFCARNFVLVRRHLFAAHTGHYNFTGRTSPAGNNLPIPISPWLFRRP